MTFSLCISHELSMNHAGLSDILLHRIMLRDRTALNTMQCPFQRNGRLVTSYSVGSQKSFGNVSAQKGHFWLFSPSCSSCYIILLSYCTFLTLHK